MTAPVVPAAHLTLTGHRDPVPGYPRRLYINAVAPGDDVNAIMVTDTLFKEFVAAARLGFFRLDDQAGNVVQQARGYG